MTLRGKLLQDLPALHYGEDYDSSFESDTETTRSKTSKKHSNDTSIIEETVGKDRIKLLPNHGQVQEEYSREERGRDRYTGKDIICLNAYERHKRLINDYVLCYPGQTVLLKRDISRDKTDFDVIRENHQFLWEEDIDPDSISSWEKRLAKKYYDKLFKEYCICDLRFYKEGKIAMRWRTKREVIAGIGQFTCGEKSCKAGDKLRTWEVNFGYVEQGAKKKALVKVRLCSECSLKLNYRFQRKEVTKTKTRKSSKRTLRKGTSSESADERKHKHKKPNHKRQRINYKASSSKDIRSSSSESSTDSSSSEPEEHSNKANKADEGSASNKSADEASSSASSDVWVKKPSDEGPSDKQDGDDEDDFDVYLDDLFL